MVPFTTLNMSGYKNKIDIIELMKNEVEYMLNIAVTEYGMDPNAINDILKKRHYIIDTSKSEEDLYINVSYGRKYFHDKLRDSDGMIQCPCCPFRFTNGSTFSMHMTKKHTEIAKRHNGRHECVECCVTFNSSSDLTQHKTNAHVKPEIKCEFPDCQHKSKTVGGCISHYGRVHIGEMRDKQVCLTCNAEFNGASIHYHIARCCPTSHYHIK
uniref:C2H2-type domain-containing protein n=1 Tax=viral metagenome TaxID=1070528 RepID=A0A6C0BSE6_9ZZZZ